MACNICNIEMTVDTPTITLLCNHKFHTRCLMSEVYRFMRGPNRVLTLCTCVLCNSYIIPNDIVDGINNEELDTDIENRTIKFMWETDPKFRNDIITIKNSIVNHRSNERKMMRASQAVKKAFKEAVAPARRVIEEAKSNALKKLRALTEYKTYTSALATTKRTTNKFRATWGLNLWNLRTALHSIPDAIRTIPQRFHFYNRTQWIFRVRI